MKPEHRQAARVSASSSRSAGDSGRSRWSSGRRGGLAYAVLGELLPGGAVGVDLFGGQGLFLVWRGTHAQGPDQIELNGSLD